jgi:predicted SprT family Zn-dependent metalloprotease
MNERIRQLKEQARDFYLLQEDLDCSTKQLHELVDTKFAELIVRECAKRVDYWESRQGEHADDLLKHFGVEEQVQDSKELHTCPYREEIHNDYESLCDCDEEQQHQCAMDI